MKKPRQAYLEACDKLDKARALVRKAKKKVRAAHAAWLATVPSVSGPNEENTARRKIQIDNRARASFGAASLDPDGFIVSAFCTDNAGRFV
jgi:hypothetical protein